MEIPAVEKMADAPKIVRKLAILAAHVKNASKKFNCIQQQKKVAFSLKGNLSINGQEDLAHG